MSLIYIKQKKKSFIYYMYPRSVAIAILKAGDDLEFLPPGKIGGV